MNTRTSVQGLYHRMDQVETALLSRTNRGRAWVNQSLSQEIQDLHRLINTEFQSSSSALMSDTFKTRVSKLVNTFEALQQTTDPLPAFAIRDPSSWLSLFARIGRCFSYMMNAEHQEKAVGAIGELKTELKTQMTTESNPTGRSVDSTATEKLTAALQNWVDEARPRDKSARERIQTAIVQGCKNGTLDLTDAAITVEQIALLPQNILQTEALQHVTVVNLGTKTFPPKGLPNLVRHLPNMEELHLSGCKRVGSLDTLRYCNSLKILDLCDCGLTEIPSGVKELVTLEELNLNDNHINDVPGLNKLVDRNCSLTSLKWSPKNESQPAFLGSNRRLCWEERPNDDGPSRYQQAPQEERR